MYQLIQFVGCPACVGPGGVAVVIETVAETAPDGETGVAVMLFDMVLFEESMV